MDPRPHHKSYKTSRRNLGENLNLEIAKNKQTKQKTHY